MQSIGLPDNILHNINRALYSFLWKKKHNNKKAFEKVKRKVLAQEIEKGGLGMIDMKLLQEALYLGWVPRLLDKSTDKQTWKTYPISIYTKLGLNLDIFNTPCLPQDLLGLPRHTGDFWSNVLRAWLKLRSKYNENEDDLHQLNINSALWNNNNFQFKNKNLHFNKWIEAGMYKIRDILNERKEMIPFADLLNILPAATQLIFLIQWS